MRFVIAGAGAAGTSAAQALREKAPQAEIIVYTNENYPYYGKPRLPEFLADEVELEQIYFHNEEWYESNRIDFRKGKAITKIDADKQKIVVGQDELEYDKLLLACGSRPLELPIEGIHREGVFNLWSISDAIHMKQFARGINLVAVIGGGFLGIETARSLKNLGLDVTLIEIADRLMPRQLDETASRMLKEAIERQGIKILLGEVVKTIESKTTKMEQVRFASGESMQAAMVVIAAGAMPNKEIAKSAGIVTNKGVIVDKHMRTSSKNIYAAGDVAEFAGKCYGIIPAALEQAKVAASNMIVEDALDYEGTVPINTLKGFDMDLTCIGTTFIEDETGFKVIEFDSPEEGMYKKALLRKNRLTGVILIGTRKNIIPFSTIIGKGLEVSSIQDELLNEEMNLQEFIRDSEDYDD